MCGIVINDQNAALCLFVAFANRKEKRNTVSLGRTLPGIFEIMPP
jgi:hypothetical protein